MDVAERNKKNNTQNFQLGGVANRRGMFTTVEWSATAMNKKEYEDECNTRLAPGE